MVDDHDHTFTNEVLPWLLGGMILLFFGALVYGGIWTVNNPEAMGVGSSAKVLGENKQKEAACEPLKKPEGLTP